MKKLKLGSTWMSLLEQIVYIAPTLSIVLYDYFTQLESSVTTSSKASFGLAISLLFIGCIYLRVFKQHLADLRQGLVQSEYDLKNGVGDPAKVAETIKSSKLKLEGLSRLKILIVLFIIAVITYIFEEAAVRISTLVWTGVLSVAAGAGIHVGVLELEKSEAIEKKDK